jgi:rod shape determining protein RodA
MIFESEMKLESADRPQLGWRKIFDIDWLMFFCALLLSFAGLVTMDSFVGNNSYFNHQLIWLAISTVVFFGVSLIDYRFLRRTGVVVTLFMGSFLVLLVLFALGSINKGAQSWFNFGGVSLQPADPIKLVMIVLLSKYFSRRHIEIANFRHILVSGFYAFVIFGLVAIQPDFGTAIIIFLIWFGMVLISGISKKHLIMVILGGIAAVSFLWVGVFHDYQKQRIINFIQPLTDIRGAGYSAYQSTIAVGSGEWLGKGIGYGTQSKLKFLPEYQTDFIFAAFAEEWGFIGVLLIFILFAVLIWRILAMAHRGATNFEILFGAGLAILFLSHFIINAGMNIGLLPVTGVTFPFMSYGGSNLLSSYFGLGVLMGMRRYHRTAHSDKMKNEFLGL